MYNLNNIIKTTVVLSAVVLLTSCNTYKHSYRQSNIPDTKVNVADKIAVELEMDESKVIRATTTHRHASVQDAKDEAYYNAITQNNIHVLVDPVYRVTTAGKILIFGGKSTAEVIGFAGYYRNPQSLTELEDARKAEKNAEDQEKLDAALANMKMLKDAGAIVQNTSQTATSDVCGKKNCVITKESEETSLVDAYNEFVKGVEDPSSASTVKVLDVADSSDEVLEPVDNEGILAKIKRFFQGLFK
jgi:hypothetical protein